MGRGRGGSQGGRGGGQGGRGRKGGPKAAGPEGTCVCPQCSHQVRHVAGKPCMEMTRPKCGTRMVRA